MAEKRLARAEAPGPSRRHVLRSVSISLLAVEYYTRVFLFLWVKVIAACACPCLDRDVAITLTERSAVQY